LATTRTLDPWLLGAPLSPHALQTLNRQNNFHGSRLDAAGTDNLDTIQRILEGNTRAARDLPYNKQLTAHQAHQLAARAVERCDGELALALIWGGDDLGELLAANPTLLTLVGPSRQREGISALARRLRTSTLENAEHILDTSVQHQRLVERAVAAARQSATCSLPCHPEVLDLIWGWSPHTGLRHLQTMTPHPARIQATINSHTCHTANCCHPQQLLAPFSPSIRQAIIDSAMSDPNATGPEMALLMHTPWIENIGTLSENAHQYQAEQCAQELNNEMMFLTFERLLPTWSYSLRELLNLCRALLD
jgi:hypothetical protein